MSGPSPPSSNLLKLDSVVHNFLECLNPSSVPGVQGARGFANAERFHRVLEYSPPAGGPVLGPPVLCGVSPSVGLEGVFGFLGHLRMTGTLRIQADRTTFMISVVKGDVVHAVSHPRPEGELLGNILMERGAIDAHDLGRFFDRCGSSAGRIGEALNREELASTGELREALEIQLQLLFDRLLAAEDSEWCFHEGEAILSYVNLRMNPTSVLLQSARKRDEGSAA